MADFIRAEVRACSIAQYAAQLVNAIADAKHTSSRPLGPGGAVYIDAAKEDIASIRTALAEIEAVLGFVKQSEAA